MVQVDWSRVTTQHTPRVGPKVHSVFVDDALVGFITVNYDFIGRAFYSARVGTSFFDCLRVDPKPESYEEAVQAILQHVS